MFTGWRSKRRLRRHVAIPEHHSLKRRAARMKKPRPTNDRGSACQTIWCRYAPGIAGSMAKFSAKRKGRQSFALIDRLPQITLVDRVTNSRASLSQREHSRYEIGRTKRSTCDPQHFSGPSCAYSEF